MPEDWGKYSIQELIDTNAITGHLDGNHGALYPRSHEFRDFGVPYITANDLCGHKVSFSNCKYLEEERARQFRKGVAKNGDVLFAHNATVGPTALLSTELDYVILSTTATYFRCNPAKLNNTYVLYTLQSPFFVNQYQAIMAQSTRNQVPITAQRKLSILIPPTLAEQEAIAGALTDVDALIESLEQIIAKKRLVKQGTMQELLTGKRRLPGFETKSGYKKTEVGVIPKDWECIQLPALAAQIPDAIRIGPFGSALKKEYLTKVGYKVYGQENVYERNMSIGERFITVEHFRKLRSCEIMPGDYLISMMGTVGKCFIVPPGIEAGIMDSHLLRLRLNPLKLNADYLSQLFQTRTLLDQVKQLSVGGIMEGLSSKIIKGIKLPTPLVAEQTSIAAILSDIDAEIAALEEKLAKARLVKQGMMQELLTGRIRLV